MHISSHLQKGILTMGVIFTKTPVDGLELFLAFIDKLEGYDF
jgi:hypothetical protein